jgi:hypothetical protein
VHASTVHRCCVCLYVFAYLARTPARICRRRRRSGCSSCNHTPPRAASPPPCRAAAGHWTARWAGRKNLCAAAPFAVMLCYAPSPADEAMQQGASPWTRCASVQAAAVCVPQAPSTSQIGLRLIAADLGSGARGMATGCLALPLALQQCARRARFPAAPGVASLPVPARRVDPVGSRWPSASPQALQSASAPAAPPTRRLCDLIPARPDWAHQPPSSASSGPLCHRRACMPYQSPRELTRRGKSPPVQCHFPIFPITFTRHQRDVKGSLSSQPPQQRSRAWAAAERRDRRVPPRAISG